MAKKSMVARELKRIKTVQKYAEKRAKLKAIANDLSRPFEERMEALEKLNKLPRNASPVRVQRRCRITGRPHAVYRKFGLSRNMIRQLGMQGDIPGLKKASW
ncbi:SSU ribosomal protein S14P [Sulfurivirga caldicuralii]|uniref:Small ribosomal subunit protein uS14 n=1 Tax=Sulfurivirga caldicuralii TaxID=364032 RepID=A0A1N6DLJ2_9GAMM|nr:30S ribosomal protein S14 [Sulfurivirga caldicuralii]SIN71701.1 SSU ribosomal protein S14P [Sulfurivirga caldicuralii]